MRHHTKDKGDIGLGCVMADLLKHDIQIALPVSEHLPFDLIAIHPRGDMLKVSVKYRIMNKRGAINVRSQSVWNDRNGTHYRRHDIGDYDAVAIYCPDTDACYYIRASELAPLCTSLRITEPVNRQKAGVHMAQQFTDPDRLFQSAPVAQWIEQAASNRQAEGSIPSGGASRSEVTQLVLEGPPDSLAAVTRRVTRNGIISVSGQALSVGSALAGDIVTVHVGDDLLHVWWNGTRVRTVPRTSRGAVRKKNACRPAPSPIPDDV